MFLKITGVDEFTLDKVRAFLDRDDIKSHVRAAPKAQP